MPADQDVLQKLDALLSKHRGASGGADTDSADIPVLTDVIEPADATQAAPLDLDITSPEPLPATSEIGTSNGTQLSDAEIETLARDIFQHVMADLSSRISGELQHHLTERLSSIIDKTVATAIDDFKQDLADVVGDAIAGALLDRAERMAATPPTKPKTSDS